MKIEILKKDFAICKSKYLDGINLADELLFISKTDKELYLVCEESSIPKDCTDVEIGWKAF